MRQRLIVKMRRKSIGIASLDGEERDLRNTERMNRIDGFVV